VGALLPILLAGALGNHALLLALTGRGRARWRLPLVAALALGAAIATRFAAPAPATLVGFAFAFAVVALAASLGESDAKAAAPVRGWRRHLHLVSALTGAGAATLAFALIEGAWPSPRWLLAPIALVVFALSWPALHARLEQAPLARAWREGPATLILLAFAALAFAGLAGPLS
jgi:hypothetical protein